MAFGHLCYAYLFFTYRTYGPLITHAPEGCMCTHHRRWCVNVKIARNFDMFARVLALFLRWVGVLVVLVACMCKLWHVACQDCGLVVVMCASSFRMSKVFM